MKIFDTVIFFNELALLEARMYELVDRVDYFVIVEATSTFSGKPKPLYFQHNRESFSSYADKIIHVIVDDLPIGTPNSLFLSRTRKLLQQDAIIRGLKYANEDDLVMVSNADEIPFGKTVDQAMVNQMASGGSVCMMDEYCFGMYYRSFTKKPGTVVTTFKNILQISPSIAKEEWSRCGFAKIDDGGCHLVNFFDEDGIQYKLDAGYRKTLHGMPIERISEARRTGVDIFGGRKLVRVKPDYMTTMPRMIKEQREGIFVPFFTHPDDELTENQFALSGTTQEK